MKYDFDKIIDRKGTHALKWDYKKKSCADQGVLPFWVADMDFQSPDPVIQAVQKRAQHGIFGYTLLPESYYQAVIDWMQKRYQWTIQKKWVVFSPGVVPALNFAVHAFSEPGDKIIIQPPVYYPFSLAVRDNKRQLVNNPLQISNGRIVMDFEHLKKVIDSRTRMLILCSPHNPVARVWSKAELLELAEICLKHDVLILSDEIHADLVLPPHVHIPTACLSPEIAEYTITCTSPNKTFNSAGLQIANNIISNPRLRERFQMAVNRAGIELANAFGVIALEASYNQGEEWLEQLLVYLSENYAFLCDFITKGIPCLKVFPLEGTYLVWIDARAIDPDDKKIKQELLSQAKIWLDEGSKYGPGGEGFLRMNIACPRSVLGTGLQRMAKTLNRLR